MATTRFIACLCCVCAAAASGAAQTSIESRVKAAYIVNFVPYISWPEGGRPDTTLIIGTIGPNTFGREMDSIIKYRSAPQPALKVQHFADAQQALSCNILYVKAKQMSAIQALLASYEKESILTVGETEKFMDMGGIVAFVLVNNTVQFEINLAAARRSRIQINSRLLALAHRVIDDENTDGQ